MYRKLVIINTK